MVRRFGPLGKCCCGQLVHTESKTQEDINDLNHIRKKWESLNHSRNYNELSKSLSTATFVEQRLNVGLCNQEPESVVELSSVCFFFAVGRLSCLSTCLDLLKQCCLLYKDLVSFKHVFQPITTLLSKHLPAQPLPELLQVGVAMGFWRFPLCVYVCINVPIPLCAGAPQGDPGDRRRRSLRAPSSGVRQEEADSSQAPHAQAGGSVSRNGGGDLSRRRRVRGRFLPLSEVIGSVPAGWTMGRSAATPGRRRRGSVWSTSSSGSTRAPWGRSGRTRASWPARSSRRSWAGEQRRCLFIYLILLDFGRGF